MNSPECFHSLNEGDFLRRAFLILAIFVFLFILGACGQSIPPSAPSQFSAEAQITFGESKFTAQVSQERPGALSVEFIAPEELQGMRLILQGDSTVLRYGELETELPASSLPAAGFAPVLNGVLLRMAQPSTEGYSRARGGSWTLNGAANGLNYLAKIDTEGVLTQVEVPAVNLEVKLLQH